MPTAKFLPSVMKVLPPRYQHSGFSIIEVMLALGMATVVILSVGNTLIANQHVVVGSLVREQALNLARQTLEQVQQVKDQAFGCSVASGQCHKGTQSCTPNPGYTSCWLAQPVDTNGDAVVGPTYHVDSTTMEIKNDGDAVNQFTRTITFASSGDDNVKMVTVDVSWTESGVVRHTTLATEITAWKNL